MLSFQVPRNLNNLKALGKSEFTSLVESSIEVFTEETGTVVACHHSIRVEHGHHVENEGSTELFGYWLGTSQIF